MQNAIGSWIMMTSCNMHIKLNNVTGDMSHITGTAALENMGLCCFTLCRNIWSFPVTLHVFGSSHFCLELSSRRNWLDIVTYMYGNARVRRGYGLDQKWQGYNQNAW